MRAGPFSLAVAAAADGRDIAVGTTRAVTVFAGTAYAQTSRPTTDGAVNSLAFDRTGTVIAAGEQKGTTVWDTRAGKETALLAPGDEVSSATFNRDGNLVLVTAGSRTTLWDWAQARVIADLPSTSAARAAFSPDGRWIVLAGRSRLELVRCEACAPLEEQMRRARSLLPAGG